MKILNQQHLSQEDHVSETRVLLQSLDHSHLLIKGLTTVSNILILTEALREKLKLHDVTIVDQNLPGQLQSN